MQSPSSPTVRPRRTSDASYRGLPARHHSSRSRRPQSQPTRAQPITYGATVNDSEPGLGGRGVGHVRRDGCRCCGRARWPFVIFGSAVWQS